MNKPLEISLAEWQEIVKVPEVREGWQLTAEELADSAYGVKYDFTSGGPGYCGDLYILYGDALSGYPLVLVRDDDTNELLVVPPDID